MNLSPAQLLSYAVLLVPLVPLHYAPELYFRTEWVFAMMCSLAWFVTKGGLRIPPLGSMPGLWMLGLVAIASLASAAFDRGNGPQPVMVPLYCAFAAGVYILTRAVGAQDGNWLVPDRSLAIAMLFSGLLAVVPAAFQLNRLDRVFFLISSRGDHAAVVGNMAQANQLGDWVWLAIVSLAYLGATRHIGKMVAILAMMPLTLAAVTTASRSVWLYPLVVMLGVGLVRREGDQVAMWFLRLVLGALLIQVAVHLLFVVLGGYDAFGLVSSVDRLGQGDDDVNGNVRTAIWLRTLEVIRDAPWWGTGSGSFRHMSLEKLLENRGGVVPVGEHAHNLFLQLAVEYGVPLSLVILAFLCWWLTRCFACKLSGAGLWSFASLAVMGVHSMMEYPLWLAYFLGLAGVHLAIVDRQLDRAMKFGIPLWIQRTFGTFAIAILLVIGMQYRSVESAEQIIRFQMSTGIGGAAGLPQLTYEMLEALDSLPRWSPWRGYAEAATIRGAFPESKDAPLWVPRCRRVVQSDDSSLILARCSMIMALSGENAEANRIAELGCLDYPRKSDRFPELMLRLGRLMKVERTPQASCL